MESMETLCMREIYNYCIENDIHVNALVFDSIVFIPQNKLKTIVTPKQYCNVFNQIIRERLGFKYVEFQDSWNNFRIIDDDKFCEYFGEKTIQDIGHESYMSYLPSDSEREILKNTPTGTTLFWGTTIS
jgi:hypothetical protein